MNTPVRDSKDDVNCSTEFNLFEAECSSLKIINSKGPKGSIFERRDNSRVLTIGLSSHDKKNTNPSLDSHTNLSTSSEHQQQMSALSDFIPVNLVSSYLQELFNDKFPKPFTGKSTELACKWGCVSAKGAKKLYTVHRDAYFLIRHYRTKHKYIPVKDYGIKCHECKAYFFHDVILEKHLKDGVCIGQKMKVMALPGDNYGKNLTKDVFMRICAFCDMIFLSQKRFKKHLCKDIDGCSFEGFEHPMEMGRFDYIECKFCAEKFLLEDDFLYHMKPFSTSLSINIRPINIVANFKCKGVSRLLFSCSVCFTKFSAVTQFRRHIFYEHKLEEFELKCDRCHQQFRVRAELNNHMTSNAKYPICVDFDACRTIPKRTCDDGPPDETFKCPVCPMSWSNRNRLLHHLTNYHSDYNIDQLKCGDCNSVFLTVKEYENHMTKWKCPFCVEPQIFPKKRLLSEHCRRFHTIAREQEQSESKICQFCNATLKNERTLQTHISDLHANLLNACPFCGETSDNKINMFKHIRSFHVYQPPKPKTFCCDLCASKTAFTDKDRLARHVAQVHNKAEKTECDICHKTFAQRATMMRHRRIHLDIKPFKCGICELTFTQKTGMRAHKARHYNKDGTLKSADEIKTQVEIIKQQREKQSDPKVSDKESIRSKKKKKLLTCEGCGYHSAFAVEYDSHICKQSDVDKVDSEDEETKIARYDFDCKNCNKSFVSSERLYAHRCLKNKSGKQETSEGQEDNRQIGSIQDFEKGKPKITAHKLRKSKRAVNRS